MSEDEIIQILLCENIGELAYCGLLDKLDESNNNDLNELKKQAVKGLLDLYQKEKALAENHKIAFEKQTENLHEVKDLYQKEKEKNKRQAEHIQGINKRNENLRTHLKLLQAHRLKKYMMDNYISKDKISGKIEELDIEIQQCQYADDDIEEYKNDMEKEKSRLLRDKKILQELLGENNGKQM